MICEKCGHALQVGEFPFCRGTAADHGPWAVNVIGDEILGGENVGEHVEGRDYVVYSKSEKRRYLKEHGAVEYVRHVPTSKDGDTSRHTTRWV